MEKTLQEMFIESAGQPVSCGDWLVRQLDVIPVRSGNVLLRFLRGASQGHGMRLKAKGGRIVLSDGSSTEIVDTWRAPGLPDEVSYHVDSHGGQVKIWNIYSTQHYNGTVTVDMWTGNAGLVILAAEGQARTYGCSRNTGEFDPDDLVVRVEWSDLA